MSILYAASVMMANPFLAAKADVHQLLKSRPGICSARPPTAKWIKSDEAAKAIRMKGRKIYGLTQSFGEAKGGKPKPAEEEVCSDVLTVSLSPNPDKGAIALAAPWNALPRKVQILDASQQVYVDAARDFLRTKGIDKPKVKLESILRVDLDGDGEEEVLISATNYFEKYEGAPMRSPAGSYSMVLLRRLVAGKVETQLVEGEFYSKAYQNGTDDDASFNAPNVYKVIAVLDLDGDGKMEVVVASQYYEGGATTIYRCDPKKIESLLSVACGV
jgi:hypothetical protein